MKNIDLSELTEFAETHTATDIKNKYGENGYKLCLKHRIKYNYKKYTYNDDFHELRKNKIIEDIKNGLPLSCIAKIYNCLRQYISQVKKR